jgi:hypothetical protein
VNAVSVLIETALIGMGVGFGLSAGRLAALAARRTAETRAAARALGAELALPLRGGAWPNPAGWTVACYALGGLDNRTWESLTDALAGCAQLHALDPHDDEHFFAMLLPGVVADIETARDRLQRYEQPYPWLRRFFDCLVVFGLAQVGLSHTTLKRWPGGLRC